MTGTMKKKTEEAKNMKKKEISHPEYLRRGIRKMILSDTYSPVPVNNSIQSLRL